MFKEKKEWPYGGRLVVPGIRHRNVFGIKLASTVNYSFVFFPLCRRSFFVFLPHFFLFFFLRLSPESVFFSPFRTRCTTNTTSRRRVECGSPCRDGMTPSAPFNLSPSFVPSGLCFPTVLFQTCYFIENNSFFFYSQLK